MKSTKFLFRILCLTKNSIAGLTESLTAKKSISGLNLSLSFLNLSKFNKPMLASCFLLIASLTAWQVKAADTPLDDPYIVFCLINFPVDEVGDCIDQIPNKGLDVLRANKVQVKPRLSFEIVLPEDDRKIDSFIVKSDEPKAMSVPFYCPNEFGRACDDVATTFVAVGGHCKRVENNLVCYYP